MSVKAFLLGTKRGCLLLNAAVAVLILLLSATVLWFEGQDFEVGGDGALLSSPPPTFVDAIWMSYAYFIDPGTQTGLEVDGNAAHHATAVAISLIGFMWVLVVFGTVSEQVSEAMSYWRRTYARVDVRDHTLILGWNDKTLFLVGELAQMLSDSQFGRGEIVVLGEQDHLEMAEDSRVAYPDWRAKFPRVRLTFWQGKPFEVDDLERVSIAHARHIIVLGCSREPRVADSQVVATLCAMQCLPQREWQLALKKELIINVSLRMNAPVVRQLSTRWELARCCAAKSHIDALLAMCALSPTVGQTLIDLMCFEGAEFEPVEGKAVWKDLLRSGLAEDVAGRMTFGEISDRLAKGVLVGVLRRGAAAGDDDTAEAKQLKGRLRRLSLTGPPKGLKPPRKVKKPWDSGSSRGRVGVQHLVAPRRDHPVEKTDILVVIADTYRDALLVGRPASSQGVAQGIDASSPSSTTRAALATRTSDAMAAAPCTCMPPSTAVEVGGTEERGVHAAAADAELLGSVVLFIGWSSSIKPLLDAFDARLPPRSRIIILSEATEKWRTQQLAAENLSLQGGSSTEGTASGLTNVTLEHLYGFPTDMSALERLPLDDATIAAVISADTVDDTDADIDHQIGDSEVLMSALLFRRQLNKHVRASARDTAGARFSLVVELKDTLTRRLLQRNPHLLNIPAEDVDDRSRGTVVPRGHAEGGRSPKRNGRASSKTPWSAMLPGMPSIEIGAVGSRSASGGDLGSTDTDDFVDICFFHRNYLETAALAISAHHEMLWNMMTAMIDASGQGDEPPSQSEDEDDDLVQALPVALVLGRPSDENAKYSFNELAARVRNLGSSSSGGEPRSQDVLIGWRQLRGTKLLEESVIVNPANKDEKVVSAHDELLVIGKRGAMQRARRAAERHQAAAVSESKV